MTYHEDLCWVIGLIEVIDVIQYLMEALLSYHIAAVLRGIMTEGIADPHAVVEEHGIVHFLHILA
jgi:hypothetical protein